MSYEYRVYSDNNLDHPETFEEAVKVAEGSISEYRDDAQDGWSDEVENVCILLVTHEAVMIDERPRDPEEDAHVSSMCETVCDYELQPTAEWSRIQERLKRADELEAELERVKADLKNTIDAGKLVVRNELAARVELESIKSHVKSELERIVCTEGEDAGVFFVSPESPTKYDPELNCHVYEHEHFSELGDALVGLWKMVSDSTSESCRAAGGGE